MAQQTLKSLDDTRVIARKILLECVEISKKEKRAVVVALEGDLGAGKTTFVKAVAEALGVKKTVTSPTFVIEKIYKLDKEQPFKHLIHIDAYRLDSGKELIELGWELIIKDPQAIVFIEWPERVEEIILKSAVRIKLETLDQKTKKITIPFDESS